MDFKNKIINDTYYDLAGFTSLNDHYKSAKSRDNSITLKDVKEWRSKNVEHKSQLKGYNSWTPSKPHEEYQMDLAFFDMENDKYIGALFMIDPFTKYAAATPFETKQPDEILRCIKDCMRQMGSLPETVYSDMEGSFSSREVQNYFKNNNIRWLYTNTHAAYVERLIRTIKQYVYKRMEHYDGEWYEYLWPSMLVYNNKAVHSVIGMTPSDATKKKNETEVKLKLLDNKVHTRNYPDININDYVRVYKKKDLKHKKERYSVWSLNKYQIIKISEDKHGQKFYTVRGMPKEYMRHELLLVVP
jgi:hypothetical protein